MSRTKQGKRDGSTTDQDFYETPEWVGKHLGRLGLPVGVSWLEPCAGTGALIRAFPDVEWEANEIDGDRACECSRHTPSLGCYIGDILNPEHPLATWRGGVIATNPPFFLAQKIIEWSLERADYAAMLLRLNYLGSAERREWLSTRMPDVHVIPERVSFNGLGADCIEYAWFVWDARVTDTLRISGRVSVLPTTPASVRAAQKAEAKRLTLLRRAAQAEAANDPRRLWIPGTKVAA